MKGLCRPSDGRPEIQFFGANAAITSAPVSFCVAFANACAATIVIAPSAVRQNSVEPHCLQKQRWPQADELYTPSCSVFSTRTD